MVDWNRDVKPIPGTILSLVEASFKTLEKLKLKYSIKEISPLKPLYGSNKLIVLDINPPLEASRETLEFLESLQRLEVLKYLRLNY